MENNMTLSARKLMKESFELARKNFWSYFAVIATFIVLGMLDPNHKNYTGSGLVSLLVTIASIYVSICTLSATLKIVNGETVKAKDFFAWPKTGFKTFLTNIVSSLVYLPVIIACALLFVSVMFFAATGRSHVPIFSQLIVLVLLLPTIYFGMRIMFAKYYSLEFGHMPVAAIKAAWKASNGKFWIIFRLCVLSIIVGALGLIALFIGIFWAAPTVIIAQMMLYRKLAGGGAIKEEVKESAALPEVQPLELQANPASTSVNDAANN